MEVTIVVIDNDFHEFICDDPLVTYIIIPSGSGHLCDLTIACVDACDTHLLR